MLLAPLSLILSPLLLLATLGWLLAHWRAMPSGWQGGLNALTARLFIPALLFGGAYQHGVPASVSWQFMAAFFLPLGVLFGAALALRRDASLALAATYSNTVFVGIPVLSQAFGPASLQYAFPIIAFHGLIAFALYYLAAPGASGIGKALLSALRNPIVTSLMLGMACNLLGLRLPLPLLSVLSMLAAAALPCALLALGASLMAFRIRSWGESGLVTAVKLLVLPACVGALAVFAFSLPPPAAAALVVIAACPVGVNAASLVQADGMNPAPVASAILLSSVLCIATIPAWIWLVRHW